MAFDATIPLLECTEAFTRSIIDNITQPLLLLDHDMRLLVFNGEAARLFGLRNEDLRELVLSNLLVAPQEQRAARASIGRHTWQAEARCRAGDRFMAEFTLSLVQSTHGRRYLVAVRDLTEQQRFEDELHAHKALSEITLDGVADAILNTGKDGIITFANRAASRLLGRDRSDLVGQRLIDCLRFHNPHHNEHLEGAIYGVLHGGGSVRLNDSAELLNQDGDAICVDGRLTAVCNRAGDVTGCTTIIRDVSTERRMQAVLSFKATHDELTGLINRSELERRLHEQVLQSGSTREPCSVLMVDLDRFKLVNDNYGHMAGDLLLRQLTRCLLARIRNSDSLARIGGDRFALLLPRCSEERAVTVAQTLRRAAAGFRFAWEDEQIKIGVSIGVVTIDHHMHHACDVVTAADAALLIAKEGGRDRVVVYRAEGLEEQRRRGEVLWANRIREALEKDRLRLYCQPIVPLDWSGGRDWSCEVLVRMLDKDGHMVPPMAFIPAAERYDLMPLVDRWVIRSVIEHWQCEPEIFGQINKCNINLSGQSLAQEGFHDFLINLFDKSGFPHELACFEITETAVVANMQNAKHLIHELSARGCRFALDDFGSGLSSFAYLKHLPVNYLKIDGAFVRDMLNQPMDAAMVRAIADIGHTLGLETIAEFVENKALIAELRRAGVDYAQGFAVQRPFPLSNLTSYRPMRIGA